MNGVKEFCEYLIHEYLENCNYDIFEQYIDPDISVIGTGGSEFFLSREDFDKAIKQEEEARAELVRFAVQKKEIWPHKIGESLYLVVMRIAVREISPDGCIACEMEFRVTMVLKHENDWKILHLHQSTPDPYQSPGEFFPNGMVGSMNQQLKELVETQTHALRDMNEKLQYAVEHDYLTGLYNRAHFEAAVTSILRSCPRNQGVFVMLDVDDFKLCNDKYGHLLGDEVLTAIGKWMEREFPDGLLAHYGGDEFTVFLDKTVKEREEFSRRMEKALLALRQDPFLKMYEITVSAGIAFRKDEQMFEELYRYADQALYEAKENGKNSFLIAGESAGL